MIPANSYISKEFVALAGPYDPASEKEMQWLQSVVSDMKRDCSIEWRVTNSDKGFVVERKGMILNAKRN
jgi:hypothetical protein